MDRPRETNSIGGDGGPSHSSTQGPPGGDPPSIPEFEEGMNLRDCLEVVIRRKWAVLTVLSVTFIVAAFVTVAMKPVYRAEGRVELSLQPPRVTKFEDVTSTRLQTREFIQTYLKLLQSSSLASRVIERLQMEERLAGGSAGTTGSGGGWRVRLEKWRRAFSGEAARHGREDDVEDASNPEIAALHRTRKAELAFKSKLQVQPEGETTILSIAFSDTDPQLARDTVNTLMQEFIRWRMDTRMEAADTARQQLEKHIEVARAQLEMSEEKLNEFARQAGIVSLEPRLNLIYRQLEETNKACAEAQAERIAREALFRQAEDGNIGLSPQGLESEVIRNLQLKYYETLSQYEELAVTFKDEYPRLKTLKARLSDIEAGIRGEEERIKDSLRKAYLAGLKKEKLLLDAAEGMKLTALALNDSATQYRIMEREVEAGKLIHQSLMERAREIDANTGTDISNISIVDHAMLPLHPYKPNIRLNMVLALIGGLLGGVGLAFFLEYIDNSIKRVEELSERFRIPVIGVLPLAGRDEVEDLDHMVTRRPRSAFSEAIRTARTSIQLSRSPGESAAFILITSTTAGEGKSTIASNLAQAFAASNERVVLVDCDLRRPRLHRTIGTNNAGWRSEGLSLLLSGMCAMNDAVRETGAPNLHFLPAGPVPRNPSELLASDNMRQLVNTLSGSFDRIIMDGPPAAGLADVLVLGSHVDGVILVSTLGETDRTALRIFQRSLAGINGRLLGCVVNKFNLSDHYGSYYRKNYSYYRTCPPQEGAEGEEMSGESSSGRDHSGMVRSNDGRSGKDRSGNGRPGDDRKE